MVTQEQVKKLESRMIMANRHQSVPCCPKCGSTDVVNDGLFLQFNSGAKVCKSCGANDINFPERVIDRKRGKK